MVIRDPDTHEVIELLTDQVTSTALLSIAIARLMQHLGDDFDLSL